MSTATATSMKLTAEQESENARINAENERLRKQARAKRTISLTLSYVALALVTFLMIFPLIIVVIVSFTPNAVTQTWPPKIIPSAWTLDNYTSLFQRLPIGRELLNTIVFAGAGEFRIFAQIILPNAVPAILTVGMFNFMGNWNDLLWPLIMTSKPETRTITAGLAMLTGHGSSVTPYGVVMAGALISALPLLIVFFFVQKRFVEGIAMTGMK